MWQGKGQVTEVRKASSATLMGFGGGLMLASIGLFLFALVTVANPYAGIVTWGMVPLVFVMGGLLLRTGIALDRGRWSSHGFDLGLEAPQDDPEECVAPFADANACLERLAASQPGDGIAGRKILVVDDDPALRRLIRANLEITGHRVLEASSVLDGLRILIEQPIDLVLSDVRLGDFSGWGLLALLRESPPNHKVPVILVSGEQARPELVRQLQPDDYVEKPFDIRELVARAERALDKPGG